MLSLLLLMGFSFIGKAFSQQVINGMVLTHVLSMNNGTKVTTAKRWRNVAYHISDGKHDVIDYDWE